MSIIPLLYMYSVGDRAAANITSNIRDVKQYTCSVIHMLIVAVYP